MPSKHPSSILPFNPLIFRWARNLAQFTYEEAADAIKVSADKIKEWELEASTPTLRQARLLAELYKRPFLEFFAKEVPSIPSTTLVPDFRLSNDRIAPLDEKTLKAIQSWAETQRLNAIDLFEINGDEVPELPTGLYASFQDNPETIANAARVVLGFDIQEQLSLKSTEKNNLFKIIRQKIESVGILVLRNTHLKECNARGICVFTEPLPIIVVGSDSPTGSVFTLAHEFGHILLRQSAVSGIVIPREDRRTTSRIEAWCNKFAAAFLMPETSLRATVSFKKMVAEISDAELGAYARKFAVSRHAMLVRLVQLKLVDERYYWEYKRAQFLEEEKKSQSGGIPEYYGVRYRNANGDLYTRLVLDAWASGKITNHNAGEFMGIKNLKHLFEIRAHF